MFFLLTNSCDRSVLCHLREKKYEPGHLNRVFQTHPNLYFPKKATFVNVNINLWNKKRDLFFSVWECTATVAPRWSHVFVAIKISWRWLSDALATQPGGGLQWHHLQSDHMKAGSGRRVVHASVAPAPLDAHGRLFSLVSRRRWGVAAFICSLPSPPLHLGLRVCCHFLLGPPKHVFIPEDVPLLQHDYLFCALCVRAIASWLFLPLLF